MLEKVHENPDVPRFDAERQELIVIADSLLEKLRKPHRQIQRNRMLKWYLHELCDSQFFRKISNET